jgi:hypothetical protein
MNMRTPSPGAVANLADVAATIINNSTARGDVHEVPAALLKRLQLALVDVYPDKRDHNVALAQAVEPVL